MFVTSVVFPWRTHVCMGVAAPAAGLCLLSPDQRSAAQLSHLVRHRICSVLQQWCEVQAPLTTLDPPVWASVWAGSRVTGPGWEMAADTGVTEPKGHEESHRDGEKHRQGDGGEPEERTTSPGSICVPLMLSCSVSLYFLSSTPGSAFSFLLCFLTFSLCLSLSLPLLLALPLWWLQATLSVPLFHSVMEGWLVGWRGRWSDRGLQNGETHPSFTLLLSFTAHKHHYRALQLTCGDIKGSVRQNYRKTYFLLLFYSSSDLEISISEISVSLEVNGILLVVYRELKTLARTNVNSYNRASFSPRNYFYY